MGQYFLRIEIIGIMIIVPNGFIGQNQCRVLAYVKH